jgi:hypothetical protein
MPATALPYADPATALRLSRDLEAACYETVRGLEALDTAITDSDEFDTERDAAIAFASARVDLDRATQLLALLQAEFARLDRSASLRCPIPAGTEAL